MDRQVLLGAIKNSGGSQNALEEVEALLTKVNVLEQTGRYEALLTQLTKANDKSNLLALTLEVNFAYQFESSGRQLTYEVKQDLQRGSSIDFLRRLPIGQSIYFELRLLQQTKDVTEEINEQLLRIGAYTVHKDGKFSQGETIRLQSTILGKVQDREGKPTKFFSTAPGTVNVVVIDATDTHLGMADIYDCKLALYGDPSVPDLCRLQMFGLFQECEPNYPKHIQEISKQFAHAKSTLHGVLFVFKEPHSGLLAYRLEQYMMWNPALTNPGMFEKTTGRAIALDIQAAIPWRRSRD